MPLFCFYGAEGATLRCTTTGHQAKSVTTSFKRALGAAAVTALLGRGGGSASGRQASCRHQEAASVGFPVLLLVLAALAAVVAVNNNSNTLTTPTTFTSA